MGSKRNLFVNLSLQFENTILSCLPRTFAAKRSFAVKKVQRTRPTRPLTLKNKMKPIFFFALLFAATAAQQELVCGNGAHPRMMLEGAHENKKKAENLLFFKGKGGEDFFKKCSHACLSTDTRQVFCCSFFDFFLFRHFFFRQANMSTSSTHDKAAGNLKKAEGTVSTFFFFSFFFFRWLQIGD